MAKGQPARPLTSEEQSVIQAASDRVISQCMAAAGFTWEVPPLLQAPEAVDPYPSVRSLRSGGYGADLAAELAQREELDRRASSDPGGPTSPADQAAYDAAFFGSGGAEGEPAADDESGIGCAAEANRRLYGSTTNAAWLNAAVEVGSVADVRKVLNDRSDYVEARDAWQTCMRAGTVTWMEGDAEDPTWDSGYQALYVKTMMDDRAPSDVIQRAVADEDAECQESSGLAEVREPLLPEVRAQLFEDAAVNEADRWRLQQFALSNAKEVR